MATVKLLEREGFYAKLFSTVRERFDLTLQSMADLCGANNHVTMRNIVLGVTKEPDPYYLRNLAYHLHLDTHWLLMGEGPMMHQPLVLDADGRPVPPVPEDELIAERIAYVRRLCGPKSNRPGRRGNVASTPVYSSAV